MTGESTSVEVFGQRISFGILEDLQIKERHEVKSYSGTKRVNVYERSGNLAFRVWSNAEGHRAHWGDSKTKRLEELLPQCIGGIFRHARLRRMEEEAEKQRELVWVRQRSEEAERAQKARAEQQRLENLEKCILSWQKAEQIRAFVAAYQRMCEENGEPTDPESPKGEWIRWARETADRFDPLRP